MAFTIFYALLGLLSYSSHADALRPLRDAIRREDLSLPSPTQAVLNTIPTTSSPPSTATTAAITLQHELLARAASPTVQAVAGYSYLGCYQDGDRHILSITSYIDSGLSPDLCRSYCSVQALPMFGIEDQVVCYCGSALPNFAVVAAAATECSLSCYGNSAALCGANNRVNVYSATAWTGAATGTAETGASTTAAGGAGAATGTGTGAGGASSTAGSGSGSGSSSGSTSTTSTSSSSFGAVSVSVGILAGIGVAGAAIGAVIAGLSCLLWSRRNSRHQQQQIQQLQQQQQQTMIPHYSPPPPQPQQPMYVMAAGPAPSDVSGYTAVAPSTPKPSPSPVSPELYSPYPPPPPPPGGGMQHSVELPTVQYRSQ